MDIPDLSVKQVILVRKDLYKTNGKPASFPKLAVQVAHASMAVILNMMKKYRPDLYYSDDSEYLHPYPSETVDWKLEVENNSPLDTWLSGSFTKICLAVNSEEELLELHRKAEEAGLDCSLIQDNGLTEFGGVKTYTTVAIGPAYSKDIDEITGNLSLFT